ncbi:type II secretion system F family protein [Rubneribacter sp.]|nr:type II secretion system F family protein [Candidatus Rubneribacter avistercoris]
MEGVVFGALLAGGALLGFALYGALIRGVAAVGPGSSGGLRPGREGAGPKDGSRRRLRAVLSRAEGVLAALADVLDRIAPLGRAEADASRERLERAGLSISPGVWRSARVACVVIGGSVAQLSLAALGAAPGVCAAGVLGGAGAGWAGSSRWIARRERDRLRAVDTRLPDAMELLSVAIAAGSPVEQCFREVAAGLDGPVAEEFSRIDQEVNLLGHPREAALENMTKRCRSREVGSFVAQMRQSIVQGTSVAEGLARQAALARAEAQADAIERIRKMPTKLDVVLSMCFLPPTVALVVAPTVVNLLAFLGDTMG